MTTTGIVFLLAFAGGAGLAFIRDPIFGLYTYVAVFYLHPPSRWWGESLPDLRWSFLAAGMTLAATLVTARPQSGRHIWLALPPAKIMIAFTVWFWIESFWALNGEVHNASAILLTKYIVVFYLVYRLLDTPSKVTGFLLMHLAGCLYLGLLAWDAGAPGGRLDGVGGPGIDDSNTLGMQMATAVVVGAALALHLRGWRLALCVLAIAFALNAIVLTASRGAFLSLLAGGAMVAYLKPSAHKRSFYAFAVLGALSLAYVATDQFWDRMATTQVAAVGKAEEIDTSAYSRIAMIKAQIQMAREYPFGTGHRGSETLSTQFLDKRYMSEQGERSSHNVFMTVLVEEGIPGILLSFALVGWTALTLRRLARLPNSPGQALRATQTAAIGGALAAVMMGGMFADFAQCEVQIWMLAALASLAGTRHAENGRVLKGAETRSNVYAPIRRL
jgi:O-antigen ligase